MLKLNAVKSEAVVQFVSFIHKKPVVANKTKQAVSQVKTAVIKQITQKKVVKKELKKPVQKQAVKQEQKKATELKKEKQVQKVEPEKLPEKKAEEVAVQKLSEPAQQEPEREIQVLSRQEFDALSFQEALQEAVQEVWAPPAGMDDRLVCFVALTIDWNGKLVEHFIEESSGVLVFDVAVEQAVSEIKFPRQLWGKSVIVAFKP